MDTCSLVAAAFFLVSDGEISPNTMNTSNYLILFLHRPDNARGNRCRDGELYICDQDCVFVNKTEPPVYNDSVDQYLAALHGLFLALSIGGPICRSMI